MSAAEAHVILRQKLARVTRFVRNQSLHLLQLRIQLPGDSSSVFGRHFGAICA
jgi:hypothetical protein